MTISQEARWSGLNKTSIKDAMLVNKKDHARNRILIFRLLMDPPKIMQPTLHIF
jgi:hypothetical protein